MMSDFPDYLRQVYPDADVRELSRSNNSVYRVAIGERSLVAKQVTDSDIPLRYLAAASECLAETLPVQRIIMVTETDRGEPFDAVFAEYVDGTDLASVLSDPSRETPAGLTGFFCDFIAACRKLPQTHNAFGMFKRDAPAFESQVRFIEHYGARYWGRARPFYDGTPAQRLVDDWLEGGFAAAAQRHSVPRTIVPIDANLKNFLVTPDGGLLVLNVPVVAASAPAHAVASLSTHLRHHELYRSLTSTIEEDIPSPDAALREHYELWLLLGILSFYAVHRPDACDQWRNWGSPVPLWQDFADLVGSLLGKGRE